MAGEKTEKPTPKRQREARRDGQIPKSPEIGTWVGVLVAAIALRASGAHAAGQVEDLWPRAMRGAVVHDEAAALDVLGRGLTVVVTASLPLAVLLMVVGILVTVAQTKGNVSKKQLKPKMSNLNPLPALKRMLSPLGLWETAKSLVKIVVLGVLGWRTIDDLIHQLVDVGHVPALAVAARTADASVRFVRDAALLGLGLAAVDYALNRRRIGKSIKMSKQDVKDEAKQSEGNPEVKGKIKSKQLQMARRRVLEAVPRADAVIVNPTHIAIAIAYQPGSRAPVVLARGAGVAAAKIRELAEEHRVPIVRDVPLARTLWKVCDVGDEVPPQLFEAVARILAFVYGLKRAGRVRRLDGAPHEVALR